MPEGHTIHRIARDLKRDIQGQTITVRSPQGRFIREAGLLDQQVMLSAEAKGKHLFVHWNRPEVLHVHLGLYGRLRRYRSTAQPIRGQIRVRLVGDSVTVDLHGPNQCELLSREDYEDKLQAIGEDPLRNDASPERVHEKLSKTKRTIGVALLDQ